MNNIERIEPHAKRLEDVADKMEAAGIGLHADGGHVAVLRRMAAKMRSDAAQGKIPHAFGADAISTGAPFNKETTQMPHPHIVTLSAAAADPMKVRLVQQVRAQARSLGVELNPDEPIDSYKLSDELRAKGATNEQRFRLKTNLANLGAL